MSPMRVCVMYLVMEVTLFRGLCQLMGMERKITHARATDQYKDSGRI